MKTFFKYAISIILFLFALVELFTGSILSAFLILFAGLLIIPPLRVKLKESLPFIKSGTIWRFAPVFLFLIAVLISPNGQEAAVHSHQEDEKELHEVIDEVKPNNSEEITTINSNGELVQKSIVSTTSSIDNIKWTNTFNKKDIYGDWSQVCRYATGKISEATFTPEKDEEQFKLKLTSSTYQSTYPNGLGENPEFKCSWEKKKLILKLGSAVIKSFSIKFDESSKYVELEFSDGIIRILERGLVNHESFSKSNETTIQKVKKSYKERFKEFEENCINPWNGEHRMLVELVKSNLHEPSSFEHVETRAKLFNDHSVVIMDYRAKNAFGVLILNSVSARTTLKNCNVLELLD